MEAFDPVPHAYLFFARAFSHPRKEFYDRLASGEVQAWLKGVFARLPFDLSVDEALQFSAPWEEVDPEFIETFDMSPTGAVPCPLYEGLVRRDQTRQEVFEDLLRFYEHFGVSFREEQREYPDRLCVELEFVAYLAQAERQALESGRQPRPLRLAQRDFLERHLLAWFPLVNQKIPNATGEPFYVRAGSSLGRLLRNHHQYLQERLATGGIS